MLRVQTTSTTAGRCLPPLVLALTLAAGGSAQLAHEPAPVFAGVGVTQRLGEYVPMAAEVVTEDGRTVTLRELAAGRPVLLNFVYFSCRSICTPLLSDLTNILRDLDYQPGVDFDVVSLSIEPKETPELARAKKASYLELLGRPEVGRGWHFVTARQDQIAGLTSAAGFGYRWDEESQQFAHPASLIFLTADGRIARYLNGIGSPLGDVRFALVEAGEGRVGSFIDIFFFKCFHYDNLRGRYTPRVLNIARMVGALTVILLGGLILRMLMAEKRSRSGHDPAPAPAPLAALREGQ